MRALAALALLVLLAGCGGTPAPRHPSASPPTTQPTASARTLSPPAPSRTGPGRPLAGVTIALDPGHQLGNHNFPAQTGRLVDAGGFEKPCNTTGTATLDGWPEATFNFDLALAVRHRLERLGARVLLTRTRNSQRLWGPCVNVRGRFAGRHGADLLLSLHADGADPDRYGFHVIAAPGRPRALRLAEDLRAGLVHAGLPRSTYIAGGLVVRSDLATLNLATVPAVMVECGNMRNAVDAARLRSAAGRASYAAGIVAGIRAFLRR